MGLVITISGKAESGKDTFANCLKEILEKEDKRVCIIHYADYLKFIAEKYFNWNGKKDKCGRSLLQTLGTDVVRNRDYDFWVTNVSSFINIFLEDFDLFLIPDCRFPNEIEFMRNSHRTISINIKRPDHANSLTPFQRNHPSETALDNYEFDFDIPIRSGASWVYSAAEEFLKEINI